MYLKYIIENMAMRLHIHNTHNIHTVYTHVQCHVTGSSQLKTQTLVHLFIILIIFIVNLLVVSCDVIRNGGRCLLTLTLSDKKKTKNLTERDVGRG